MDFWNDEVFGNAVWRWLVFVIAVAASAAVSRLASWLLEKAGLALGARLKLPGLERILLSVRRPLAFLVLLTGVYLALFSIESDGHAVASVGFVAAGYSFVLAVCLVIMLSRVYGDGLLLVLRKRAADKPGVVEHKLVPLAVTMGRVIIWSLGLLLALSNAGVDVTSLIAGLGIGGIAVAMAAKDTLANIFAGVSLFADKVFEIGDEVVVKGTTGKVEHIGIRTTRIRTGDDSILVIPNSAIADSPLENLSHRRKRRQVTVLPLTYGTTHAMMQQARQSVQGVLTEAAGVSPDFTVRFEEFGDTALRLKIIYWVEDLVRFADLVDEVNTEILHRFDQQGIHFAQERSMGQQRQVGDRNYDATAPLADRLVDLVEAAKHIPAAKPPGR